MADDAVSTAGDTAVKSRPSEVTARVVVHPSEMIPAIPGFVFHVPSGWVLDEAPDALCVVRTPKEVDGFWVNAILTHTRVARSVDFKQAAEVTWAQLQKGTPDANVTGERLVRFGTNVVYLRSVEVPAPQSGRKLSQLHALFFAPARDEGKTVDFFQFIATTLADQVDTFAPHFIEMIGSFRFT